MRSGLLGGRAMKLVRLFLFLLLALALILVSFLIQQGLGPNLDFSGRARQRTFQPTRLRNVVARHYAGKRLLSVLYAKHFQIADLNRRAEPGQTEQPQTEQPQVGQLQVGQLQVGQLQVGQLREGRNRRGSLRGVVIELLIDNTRPLGEAPAAGLKLWDVADASFGRWSGLQTLDLLDVQLRVLEGNDERAVLTSERGFVNVAQSRIIFRGSVQLRAGGEKLLRASEGVWDSLSGSFRVPGAFTLESAHGITRGRELQTDLLLSRLQFQPPAERETAPAPAP